MNHLQYYNWYLILIVSSLHSRKIFPFSKNSNFSHQTKQIFYFNSFVPLFAGQRNGEHNFKAKYGRQKLPYYYMLISQADLDISKLHFCK